MEITPPQPMLEKKAHRRSLPPLLLSLHIDIDELKPRLSEGYGGIFSRGPSSQARVGWGNFHSLAFSEKNPFCVHWNALPIISSPFYPSEARILQARKSLRTQTNFPPCLHCQRGIKPNPTSNAVFDIKYPFSSKKRGGWTLSDPELP